MAIEAGFDTHELSDLAIQLYRTAEKEYPEEVKPFLRKEANKTRRTLRDKTKGLTRKKTGNLLKGIKRGNVYKHNGDFQIRVYNKAPHAHLIEHGHVYYHRGQKTEKYVPGKYPAAYTTMQMKREFPGDVQQFLDEMFRKGLGM